MSSSLLTSLLVHAGQHRGLYQAAGSITKRLDATVRADSGGTDHRVVWLLRRGAREQRHETRLLLYGIRVQRAGPVTLGLRREQERLRGDDRDRRGRVRDDEGVQLKDAAGEKDLEAHVLAGLPALRAVDLMTR